MVKTPGIHDPYWYEAVVGLGYVIDLLDEASGVASVTFQAPDVEGVDDVVVVFSGGNRTLGIQVKHTRSAAELTFADLVAPDGAKPSLLRKLTRGWKTLVGRGAEASTRLFTNRIIADPAGTSGVHLGQFWSEISRAMQTCDSVAKIAPPPEFEAAFLIWRAELSDLTDAQQLAFLRSLEIHAGAANTEALEVRAVERLTQIFGVSQGVAEQVYERLFHKLGVWTTSRRGDRAEVKREDVLDAMRVPREEPVGDHDFPPPTPFFASRVAFSKRLADLLTGEGGDPILFLSGPAGCGKTSIVSDLANRAEPVVDVRFHAFRPISPETALLPQDYSKTATAAALWGDLLIQLRVRYFAGRLAEANVPARNDLLAEDPARLRDSVLRLAAYLAHERGRPFVIAVDGLDHAARGRALEPEQFLGRPALLDWLVAPSAVPAGVKFLIAGQPDESYPRWLTSGGGVHSEEVPPIAAGDVEALLRKEPGLLPPDQIERAAVVISEVSSGNTLSAVYAAEEARTCTDAAVLRERLEQRDLHEGIDAYYHRIWQGALDAVLVAHPAVDAHLAGALTMSSARVSGTLLRGFFPDVTLNDADWDRLLKKLAPIIAERDGAYSVLHNDVRVFLTRLLQGNASSRARAASMIADYYRTAPASSAKHRDLFRSLAFADRRRELPALFSPAYVIDAWEIGSSTAELSEQARLAVAAVTRDTGWDDLHTLALGLRTVQQLESALQWLDEEGPAPPIPSCLTSEARPVTKSGWTFARVREVLTDARRLADGGEPGRARALLQRWFGAATPAEVFAEVRRHPGELDVNERRSFDDDIHVAARAWGALAQRVGYPKGATRKPRKGKAGEVTASFFGGWLRAGVENDACPWAYTLRLLTVYYPQDVEKAVRALAKAERWPDVALTLQQFATKRESFSRRFQIRASAWALMTGDPSLVDAWSRPIDEAGVNAVDGIQYQVTEDYVELFEAIAFTNAWLNPLRPASAISEDGTAGFFERRRYETGHMTLRMLLFATATVARLEQAITTDGRDIRTVARPEELGAIVEAFFAPTGEHGHEVTPYFYRRAPVLLARILDIIGRQDDSSFDRILAPILLRRAEEMPYDGFLDVLWNFAHERGRTDLLQPWALKWVGPDGEAWAMELSGRRDAVQVFPSLLREVGLDDIAREAEHRYRRSQIGYTGRKEYALYEPMEWFEAAVRDDASVWEDAGARLLSISNAASKGGDNRPAIAVEGAVTAAAAQCGPAALWRCLMGLAAPYNPPLALARMSAIDALIAVLEGTTLARTELQQLWAIGNGALVWQHDRHRLYLQHLREALLTVAASRSDTDLPGLLKDAAPRAYELDVSDSRFRFPARWFSNRSDGPAPEHLRASAKLIADLRALPLRDAITHLENVAEATLSDRMGTSSDVWRAVADCAERVRDERPKEFRTHVQRLIAITRRRTEPYSWEFDGVGTAFAALVPVMTEDEQWELCAWIIDGLSTERAQEFWVRTAAHNLASLCAIRSIAGTAAQRRAGLDKELRAQEAWVRGAVAADSSVWPTIRWLPEGDDLPRTWGAFGVRGLVQMLGGASGAHRLQAAAQGLYSLLSVSPELTAEFVPWARMLHEERRYVALLLAERLVAERPDASDDLAPLLEDARTSGGGRVQLQALVVRAAAARAGQEERHTLDLRPAEEHAHGAPASRGVLHVGPEMYGSIGLLRGGPSAVRQAVRQLAVVTDGDPDLLERRLADRLIELRPSFARQKTPRGNGLDGEMLCTAEPSLSAFADWAADEAGAGCLGDVPVLRVAQAVLEMDEPWLLTRAAESASDPAAWPVDKALDTLVAAGRGAATEALLAIAHAGVPDGEHVAGAILHTYSRTVDVILDARARWARDLTNVRELGSGTTFNGRTFVYYMDDAFEPPSDPLAGWFMLHGAGQGLVVHATVPLVPPRLWQQVLGWTPSIRNPLVWLSGSTPVARFEMLYGPIRDSVQDRLYRQPCVFRWIVTDAAWRAAQDALGATLRLEAQLETHQAGE